MTNIEAHYIKSIPWGGPGNHGQQILFRFSFHGEQPDVNLACDFGLVPLLLGNLTEYARRAEALRVTAADRSTVSACPYLVREVVKSGTTADGNLIVELNTNQGFPLSVAMTPKQAQQIIDFLVREMLRVRTAGTSRPQS